MIEILEIRDVRCDDWHWLYIEGEVTNEEGIGHNLGVEDLIEAINTYLQSKRKGSTLEKVSGIDFDTYWVNNDYAENGLPRYLKDIPEEVFE